MVLECPYCKSNTHDVQWNKATSEAEGVNYTSITKIRISLFTSNHSYRNHYNCPVCKKSVDKKDIKWSDKGDCVSFLKRKYKIYKNTKLKELLSELDKNCIDYSLEEITKEEINKGHFKIYFMNLNVKCESGEVITYKLEGKWKLGGSFNNNVSFYWSSSVYSNGRIFSSSVMELVFEIISRGKPRYTVASPWYMP